MVRAGLMAFLILVASGLGRPTNQLRILLLVAGALAVMNPLIVAGDLGFQLSFLAVFGLIVFVPPLNRALPLPRWLGLPLATSLAASLITAPLLAASFGTVSVIAPLTNLLLAAIVSPTMILAGIALAGSFVAPWLGVALGWLVQPLLNGIANAIALASRVPGASLPLTVVPWLGWVFTAVIALIGLWFYPRQRVDLSRNN